MKEKEWEEKVKTKYEIMREEQGTGREGLGRKGKEG